jgi:FkbM family methyltransferase
MRHSFRKIGSSLRGFHDWSKSAGWPAALTWAVCRAKTKIGFQPASLKIKPRQAMYPVIARLGGSTDMSVFSRIFRSDEYACLRDIASPRLILDLGANVGYSSAYFLSCFPNVRVVAIEPDPGNFEVCRRNLLPYGDRVQMVLGAIWSRRARLVLSRGSYDDAVQVHEPRGEEKPTVEGWDIPGLLALTGGQEIDLLEIDLLKIDIERSELEIFGALSLNWLPRVRNICIELHGPDCAAAFRHALADFDYDLSRSGELTICRNLRRKATPPQPAALGEREA